MKRIAMFLAFFVLGIHLLLAQTMQITGTVTSKDDGQPLPGASVKIMGTNIGTVTDLNGKYTLTIPTDAQTLEVLFVGMITQEISINGQSVIDIALEPSTLGLEEVIVVAYGTSTKTSFTGAATSIKSDKIEMQQVASISKALQGSVSGVQVVNTSGQPGTDATLRIRGIGSVNSSSAPLYVIDGAPFMGNINSINPSDIESITIGKDAVSTSLYGARAANGIVFINTKKGNKGQTRIDLKAQYGISSRAIKEYDKVGIQEYYELMWEASRNSYIGTQLPDGTTVDNALAGQLASDNIIDDLGGYNLYDVANESLIDPTTGKLNSAARMRYTPESWEDAISRTGKRQDYQLSMQGGTDKIDYYFSLGYLKDEGIIKASDFDRYSVRLNFNNQIKKWLKMGANISGATTKQNFPQSSGTAYANVFMYSRMIGPIYPVYVHGNDGSLILDDNDNPIFDYGYNPEYGQNRVYASNTNPAGTTVLDKQTRDNDNLSSIIFAEIPFLKNFKFTTNVSIDYVGFRSLDFQNPQFGDGAAVKGRATREDSRRFYTNFNQLLTYKQSFGYHNINALIGHESFTYKRNYMTAERTTFVLPGLYELAAAATATGSNSIEDNYSTEGYMARIEYDYNGKYYFSSSYRRDGSSRFAKESRWGDFYSVGASWRISQEDFFKSITFINLLKLRASYGTKGNDFIDTYYAYQGLFSTGWDNNTSPGFIISTLPSPNLKWETKKSTNIGFDLGLFNKVELNINYFVDYSADLLFQLPLPLSTGYKFKWDNVGDMKNSGIEIDFSANILRNSKLSWDINFNLTHVKNEITKLPQEQIVSGILSLEEGHSRYEFYTRDYAGTDPTTGASLWYYDELDGEGEKTGNRLTTDDYSNADKYYVGTPVPDIYGGFTNTFKAYGFDLSIFFAYSVGGKMFDSNYQSLMHGGEYGDSWHKDILNRWTPQNNTSNIPALSAGNTDINQSSSRFLIDGSYLTLRNLTCGYTLPKNIISKLDISNVRVFVSADNLFTLTKRKGFDPASSITGITGFDYIPIKVISFGINASF